MTAQNQPITHWVGASQTLNFGPITDPTGLVYLNLSGARAKFGIAKNNNSPAMLIKSTADAINPLVLSSAVIYGNTQFTISVPLVPTDTIALPPSIYPNAWYYELCTIDTSGNVSIAAAGPFILNPTITTQ